MTNRSLSLSQAIVGLDVKNFGLEYYDADGDGAMVVHLVVVIIVGYICACGGGLYILIEITTRLLCSARSAFRAKVCTMREGEHEHTAIQRNGAGEPGFGAWVPFVPSLLVCMDVRALRRIVDASSKNEPKMV